MTGSNLGLERDMLVLRNRYAAPMTAAIEINNLSKLYRIGGTPPSTGSLREDAARRLRNIFTPNRKTALASSNLRPNDSSTPPGHFWALKDVNLAINPG